MFGTLERHIPRYARGIERLGKRRAVPMLNPVVFKESAAVGHWVLLIERRPVAGADLLLNAKQRIEVIAFGMQSLAGLTVRFVVLGNSGIVDDAPPLALAGCRTVKQATDQIIHVPPCAHHDHAATRR